MKAHCTNCGTETEWSYRYETGGRRCNSCNFTREQAGENSGRLPPETRELVASKREEIEALADSELPAASVAAGLLSAFYRDRFEQG